MARNIDSHNLEIGQCAVFEGVAGQIGAFQMLFGERMLIDEDQCSRDEMRDVDGKRRWIERDKHVGGVTGGGNTLSTELNLKGRDAIASSVGGSDLGWKVGHRRQIVAGEGRSDRELLSLKLNAISRVSGEAHDMTGFFGKRLLHDG